MPWNSILSLEDGNKFYSQFFSSQCKGEKSNQLCLAEGHILYICMYDYMYMYFTAHCCLKEGSLSAGIRNRDYVSSVCFW